MKHARLALCGFSLAFGACSDPGAPASDANTTPDATVLLIDAGPKTYEDLADFPRDNCDDDESLATYSYLGKWDNTPDDGSTAFSSYFRIEGEVLKGILDLIPAKVVAVDENNLFLHRRYNLTTLSVNLCAVVDADTLTGYMAKCNGMDCTVGTLSATLVEPVTQ